MEQRGSRLGEGVHDRGGNVFDVSVDRQVGDRQRQQRDLEGVVADCQQRRERRGDERRFRQVDAGADLPRGVDRQLQHIKQRRRRGDGEQFRCGLVRVADEFVGRLSTGSHHRVRHRVRPMRDQLIREGLREREDLGPLRRGGRSGTDLGRGPDRCEHQLQVRRGGVLAVAAGCRYRCRSEPDVCTDASGVVNRIPGRHGNTNSSEGGNGWL